MTPRLKKLLIGFAISIIILVSDRVSQSSDSTTRVEKKKQPRKRPSTARVGAGRSKRIAAEVAAAKKRDAPKDYTPSQEFIPIPEEVLTLAGWGRNPFTSQGPVPGRQAKNRSIDRETFIAPTAPPIQQTAASKVDLLKIESVATLGDRTFVIINGQRYQEGDTINDMLIETIKSERITFKIGSKIIVKNVGT